jgi:hypothetical protein
MPASQRAPTTRRPMLRFGLASISIDDRPNIYKNPQLVLKPQLELAPRRPYTGSRPRMPQWRHFLMVHVKDKADELVGQASPRPISRHELRLPHHIGKVGSSHLPRILSRYRPSCSPHHRLSILQELPCFQVPKAHRKCE